MNLNGREVTLGSLRRAVLFLCAVATSSPLVAAETKRLFDGKTLTGWEGDTKNTWRVEKGAIVGGSLKKVVPRNEFLSTTRHYGDFELRVTFKLLGDRARRNAGVQFRTKRIPNHHEVSGYQADIGQHYWGALYDETSVPYIADIPRFFPAQVVR